LNDDFTVGAIAVGGFGIIAWGFIDKNILAIILGICCIYIFAKSQSLGS